MQINDAVLFVLEVIGMVVLIRKARELTRIWIKRLEDEQTRREARKNKRKLARVVDGRFACNPLPVLKDEQSLGDGMIRSYVPKQEDDPKLAGLPGLQAHERRVYRLHRRALERRGEMDNARWN